MFLFRTLYYHDRTLPFEIHYRKFIRYWTYNTLHKYTLPMFILLFVIFLLLLDSWTLNFWSLKLLICFSLFQQPRSCCSTSFFIRYWPYFSVVCWLYFIKHWIIINQNGSLINHWLVPILALVFDQCHRTATLKARSSGTKLAIREIIAIGQKLLTNSSKVGIFFFF